LFFSITHVFLTFCKKVNTFYHFKIVGKKQKSNKKCKKGQKNNNWVKAGRLIV
jgi:hypothetical protein